MKRFILTVAVYFATTAIIAQADSTALISGNDTSALQVFEISDPPHPPAVDSSSVSFHFVQTGIASWYGNKWEGRMTSSGQLLHCDSMTAAHKTLPFGTLVRVTNLKNDSVIIVKITDRLPKSSKRCIDLMPAAAKRLGFFHDGLTKVKLEAIGVAPIYKAPRKKKVSARPMVKGN